VCVDLAAFLARLLIFKTYILQSVWLEDLTFRARTLGDSGLQQLLSVDALKIHCESYTIGQPGQAAPI